MTQLYKRFNICRTVQAICNVLAGNRPGGLAGGTTMYVRELSIAGHLFCVVRRSAIAETRS